MTDQKTMKIKSSKSDTTTTTTAAENPTSRVGRQEELITGFLPHPSLVKIAGRPKIGKTHVAVSLMSSLSQGKPFMKWSIPSPRRVLFIDGDMPGKELQQRFRGWLGDGPYSNLVIISNEHFRQVRGAKLELNRLDHQQLILQTLEALAEEERRPDVIILDSLSSLACGWNKNDPEEIVNMIRFLVHLRQEGYTVIITHNAEKKLESPALAALDEAADIAIRLDSVGDEITAQKTDYRANAILN